MINIFDFDLDKFEYNTKYDAKKIELDPIKKEVLSNQIHMNHRARSVHTSITSRFYIKTN